MDGHTNDHTNHANGHSDDTSDAIADADVTTITLTHGGTQRTLRFPRDATINDLSESVERELSIPAGNQKFLAPKLGLLKPPFRDAALPLSQLEGKRVTLMGSTGSSVASLASATQAASARAASLAAQRRSQPRASAVAPSRRAADSTYTFQTLRPLPHLPHPERSTAFLRRLAADPGIVAAMKAHRFSVGLLTEMDPLGYTDVSHEGTTRILGLNRNRGEVIELRLRTDAYDGYRDYKTIRATLCHELAHNVHGPHDRPFWDLCHQIEREVARADWTSSGRTLGDDDYYDPPESDDVAYDGGGWTGGEFVLGGGGASGGAPALSRREIMASAAEARLRRTTEEPARSTAEDRLRRTAEDRQEDGPEREPSP